MSSSALRVVVVGGGLSGLTLAHGLSRAGMDVDVFDRDISAFDRRQGYELEIDPDGIRALASCLPSKLQDLIEVTSGVPARTLTVYSKREPVLQRDVAHDGDIYVDLFTLRQILLGDFGYRLHFGKVFTGFDEMDDHVVVRFADGTSAECDVLVGSDGVNSRVRQQLLPAMAPEDTGVRAIFGRTPLMTRGMELLDSALIGNRVMATDPRHRAMMLMTMRFRERPDAAATHWAPDVALAPREDYVSWAVLFPANEFDDGKADSNTLQDVACECVGPFPSGFRKVVEEGDPTDVAFTPIVESRTPEWATRRVTLIGDAIHAMPPVGTRCASTALVDARVLTDRLRTAQVGNTDVLTAIHAYEDTMRSYAPDAAREAHAQLLHTMGFAGDKRG